jgi:hypothetical protein
MAGRGIDRALDTVGERVPGLFPAPVPAGG